MSESKSLLKSLGSAAGTALGGVPGSIVGSLTGGLADKLLGGIFGGSGSKTKQLEKQMQIQNKYNKEMLDYQNQMNLENWNKQNEYNSPLAQRQRLAEAGLNENLMYDGYSLATADAVAAGSANGSGTLTDKHGSPDAMAAGIALKNMQADVALKESQTEKNLAEADSTRQNTPLDVALKKAQQRISEVNADVSESTKDNQIVMSNLAVTASELANDIARSRKDNIDADTRRMVVQSLEGLQSIVESNSRIRLNEAQATQLMALANLTYQQKLLAFHQTEGQKLLNEHNAKVYKEKETEAVADAQRSVIATWNEIRQAQNPAKQYQSSLAKLAADLHHMLGDDVTVDGVSSSPTNMGNISAPVTSSWKSVWK